MITFFHISYNLTGKWNFDINFFQVLTCFFGSDKVCPSSIQSDNSIESYRVYDLLQTDRQTDTFVKTTFFYSGGLKT